jgi:4'-phosphopantetheinyl transferase
MSPWPLGAHEVHLWSTTVDAAQHHQPGLVRLLTDDERRRSQRFRVAEARHRFIAAHAMARLLVGRYTDTPPDRVAFAAGVRGKPQLVNPRTVPDLHLNLAHSGDTAVVGLARAAVGVDVEVLRPIPNANRLAQRFFSEDERRWLSGLPPAEREAGFLTVWTCKEAYLKAVGAGIAMPLREVEVDPDGPRLVRLAGDPHEAARWTILCCRVAERALAAIAVRGLDWRLEVHEVEWPRVLSDPGAQG